jgi:hypothetical protein
VAAMAFRSLLQQRIEPGGRPALCDRCQRRGRDRIRRRRRPYKILSPELRRQIEGRKVLYSLNLRFADMRFGLADGFREIQPHAALQKTIDYGETLPRAVHPAVWTRDTGEKVLHVSPWMAEGIEGNVQGDKILAMTGLSTIGARHLHSLHLRRKSCWRAILLTTQARCLLWGRCAPGCFIATRQELSRLISASALPRAELQPVQVASARRPSQGSGIRSGITFLQR